MPLEPFGSQLLLLAAANSVEIDRGRLSQGLMQEPLWRIFRAALISRNQALCVNFRNQAGKAFECSPSIP